MNRKLSFKKKCFLFLNVLKKGKRCGRMPSLLFYNGTLMNKCELDFACDRGALNLCVNETYFLSLSFAKYAKQKISGNLVVAVI